MLPAIARRLSPCPACSCLSCTITPFSMSSSSAPKVHPEVPEAPPSGSNREHSRSPCEPNSDDERHIPPHELINPPHRIQVGKPFYIIIKGATDDWESGICIIDLVKVGEQLDRVPLMDRHMVDLSCTMIAAKGPEDVYLYCVWTNLRVDQPGIFQLSFFAIPGPKYNKKKEWKRPRMQELQSFHLMRVVKEEVSPEDHLDEEKKGILRYLKWSPTFGDMLRNVEVGDAQDPGSGGSQGEEEP
ncbi:hypothetical protein F4780DRAFT_24319 [Xylariomycetidae sp. FL0641]|nr:hypothetical protein F4780DRAFT_24319 [Xylariomycetidae sp. FL0641]